MRSRMRPWWAAALALTLLAGGTAMAAAPAGVPANGAAQGAGQAHAGGAAGNGSGGQSQGQASAGAGFGQSVSAAVYAARQGGQSGTVLAAAIHQIQLAEHPNAKGLAVALAVYQQTYAPGQGASTFTDVTLNAPWAQAAVDALQQAGVVNGTSSTTFSPNAPVTLAELATMLGRLQAGNATSTSNAPAGTPAWAQNGLAWALQTGVLDGEQGLGTPNAPLTRAQAVLMLVDASGLGSYATAEAGAPIDLQGTPPAWAHGGLALAVQLGLVQGSNGQLLADQPLTRAQMAVLLARLAVLEAEASN